jgi:hypothetical protein
MEDSISKRLKRGIPHSLETYYLVVTELSLPIGYVKSTDGGFDYG